MASDALAPRFAMVAGEASGDLLGGLLLGALKARWPQLHAAGIGGPRMTAQGFEAWWPHDKLAVSGYVEVLSHYREISGIRNQLGERLLKDKPDVFVGIDAPDFNLDLEAKLKAQGVKAIHFVSHRSGPGVASASRRSAAPPTWCCACFRSSRRSTRSRASQPPMWGTRSPT